MIHIAHIDFVAFYAPAFQSLDEARLFIERVEKVLPSQSPARIIVHQAGRMLWLADRMEELAKARPGLQILFYLIAAEACAKLARRFDSDGESRKHVRIFFEEICSDAHREKLLMGIKVNAARQHTVVRPIVDLLYDVRCDIVHEGLYYGFSMREDVDDVDVLSRVGEKTVIVSMLREDLRRLVLEGAVLAAKSTLPP